MRACIREIRSTYVSEDNSRVSGKSPSRCRLSVRKGWSRARKGRNGRRVESAEEQRRRIRKLGIEARVDGIVQVDSVGKTKDGERTSDTLGLFSRGNKVRT